MERKKSTRLGTVAELAIAWAEAYGKGRHEATVARQLAAKAGNIQPREITPLIATALNEEWKRTIRPATRYTSLSILRHLMQDIERIAGLERDSLRDTVPRMDKPDPREQTYTQADIAAALDQLPAWLRLIVLACYELGLRSGTAAELCPQHYDPQNQRILIRSKGDKVHALPVSPRLRELLDAADPDSPITPYWIALRGKHSDTAHLKTHRQRTACLQREWQKWRDRLGMQGKILHDFRRTLACRIATETGDIFNAQAALGHKHTSTTLLYLAPLTKDQDKLRAAIAAAWIPKGGKVQ